MAVCSLAGLLARELRADLLVLMTDVAGLYTGLPDDPESSVIPTYCPELHDSMIEYGSSSHGGRGGMVAKVCSPLLLDYIPNYNSFPTLKHVIPIRIVVRRWSSVLSARNASSGRRSTLARIGFPLRKLRPDSLPKF